MESVQIAIRMAFGLESVVADELRALGHHEFATVDGEISLQARASDIPKLNLWLRAADRVLLRVGEFNATNFDQLFEQTSIIDWSRYIDRKGKVPISGAVRRSEIDSVRGAQSVVKRAIVSALRRGHRVEQLPESGVEYQVEFTIAKDRVHLDLNTTGDGLHRRGYRTKAGRAPLRENLAAGIVLLSGWDGREPLVDPCCGSGTILIEAALVACGVPPGLERNFSAERWPWLPSHFWSEARSSAKERMEVAKPSKELSIFGSDVDSRIIEVARANAARAQVRIRFDHTALKDLILGEEFGTVVSNPPYGERMGRGAELTKLYQDLRDLRARASTWRFWLLSGDPGFERGFREKCVRKRKLYNGSLRVYLHGYQSKEEES